MPTNYFEDYHLEDCEKEVFVKFAVRIPQLDHRALVDLFQSAVVEYQKDDVYDGYTAAKMVLMKKEILKRLEEVQ